MGQFGQWHSMPGEARFVRPDASGPAAVGRRRDTLVFALAEFAPNKPRAGLSRRSVLDQRKLTHYPPSLLLSFLWTGSQFASNVSVQAGGRIPQEFPTEV